MKLAQIKNGKVITTFNPVEITGKDEIPNWPPDINGNAVVLIDITGKEDIKDGWVYDEGTKVFYEPLIETSPPEPTQLDRLEANTDYLVMLAEG